MPVLEQEIFNTSAALKFTPGYLWGLFLFNYQLFCVVVCPFSFYGLSIDLQHLIIPLA
jgi:hypothetical protein